MQHPILYPLSIQSYSKSFHMIGKEKKFLQEYFLFEDKIVKIQDGKI